MGKQLPQDLQSGLVEVDFAIYSKKLRRLLAAYERFFDLKSVEQRQVGSSKANIIVKELLD